MFSMIKTYATAIVGVVIAALLVAVRVLTSQNSRLRRKVETADARVKHAKAVLRKDKQVDEQVDIHLAEVAHEVEEGKHPSSLINPNTGWLYDDEDNE